MEKAIEAIGEDMARSRIMYSGKDGHVLTFPVAHGKTMNVVAFHHDPQNWESEQLVLPATRMEARRDFANWGHNVKAIIDLLNDDLDKWGIFDLGDNPLSYFNKGRICVAGDAAHATGPHHGAGAGFCIEDSAVLAELLQVAWVNVQTGRVRKSIAEVLEFVLKVFDNARRERTQWLVGSSRVSADLYEWRDKACGTDPRKIKEELLWRNHKIWNVDIEDMTRTSNTELEGMIV
jgi:salicylate hydroxylase